MTGQSESETLEPPDRTLRVWGGVPLRNPAFTGRERLLITLQRALEQRSKASVLPHALHGMGGVGKTQLAVEFAYRYADRYDVVWWIPAEQQSLVLRSLQQLGERLSVPETADLQQGSTLVLEKLAGSSLRWLLIYDNAREPEDIVGLMPPRGGHVILTSRNQTWSEVWEPIEVDIFERAESVELVRKRSAEISTEDANRLAERLGDLPLAVGQAAACQAATGMSVADYLTELDGHVRDLAKGREPSYQTTIAGQVRLALWRLRRDAPAVGELLEMFAFLSAEPISRGLLVRGREAPVTPALGAALREPTKWNAVVRGLYRYGLAEIHPNQKIQVHRLFQRVLREELTREAAQRARANVQHLLASANPGYPDDEVNAEIHAELGPHIGPAGLLTSEWLDARRVVLDQVRYLYRKGDLDGSRRLGEAAVQEWTEVEGTPGLGPDGELTLRAARYLAQALRDLGLNDAGRSLIERTHDRLTRHPDFGPEHEHTLSAAGELAAHLRVAGEFRTALEVDEGNLALYVRAFGDGDEETVRASSNLAVNLRMLSDFERAAEIDAAVVQGWQQLVSENDNRLLFAQANLARDLYGLGRYAAALELMRKILPPYRQQLGAAHPYVLLAGRTLAIALRKVGRYDEALAVAAEQHRESLSRWGAQHEHSLAAAMTHANTLRVTGDRSAARDLAGETTERYRQELGDRHPLTLAAAVNHAIALRTAGEGASARALSEGTYAGMEQVLGPGHGYTLCAASSLANDLALAGEREAARRLSARTLEMSRRHRGPKHPYTLACAVNTALDVIDAGDAGEGEAALAPAIAALGEALGADHPEAAEARGRRRADCDIEPPPT